MRYNLSRITQVTPGIGAQGTTASRQFFFDTQESAGGLEVYREDDKPHISYKEIGLLTNDGRVFERDEIEAAFIKRAREMGGDALVLQEPVKSMEAPTGWDLYDMFVFQAVVVSYQ